MLEPMIAAMTLNIPAAIMTGIMGTIEPER